MIKVLVKTNEEGATFQKLSVVNYKKVASKKIVLTILVKEYYSGNTCKNQGRYYNTKVEELTKQREPSGMPSY